MSYRWSSAMSEYSLDLQAFQSELERPTRRNAPRRKSTLAVALLSWDYQLSLLAHAHAKRAPQLDQGAHTHTSIGRGDQCVTWGSKSGMNTYTMRNGVLHHHRHAAITAQVDAATRTITWSHGYVSRPAAGEMPRSHAGAAQPR